MHTLTKNNVQAFGEKAKIWVHNLPRICQLLQEKWKLSEIIPFSNLTWSFVGHAFRSGEAVVVKIVFDYLSFYREALALNFFKGNGVVKLIEIDDTFQALLLERAIPGHILCTNLSKDSESTIDAYACVVNQITKNEEFTCSNTSLEDPFKALDQAQHSNMAIAGLDNAIGMKNKLLKTLKKRFIHGDLHLNNIIQNNHSWVAIDPKGIIGETEFEVSCFDFFTDDALEKLKNVQELFNHRLNYLCNLLDLDKARVKKWVFIRLTLSACWANEDNGDPAYFLNKRDLFFNKN